MKALFDRLRNRTAALIHDLCMVPLAWFGALWLRFNLESIPEPYWKRALLLLPLVLLIHAGMFLYFGLYRGVWRFASIPDFARILKAVLAALVGCALLVFMTTEMRNVPRSAFVMHGILLLLLLGLPRFFYRWYKDHRQYRSPGGRVLIVGAGHAGEMLARDLQRDQHNDYYPVAFVDDDKRKRGTEVRGLRVLGDSGTISKIVHKYRIDHIFIATPNASSEELRRIVTACEASNRPFRTLPRWQDLVSGQVEVSALREVSIEDLLGRDPVQLDWATIGRQLAGRTVLVSGGGGSIGSELCRQIAELQPQALIILERSEYNLYRIDMELRKRYPNLQLHSRLGDVYDETLIRVVLERYRPQVVLHAAAYKHVPLLEEQAREAIRNNLLGTACIARCAAESGCENFVLISTDKAVNPSNVMGASKQLAELYCQSLSRISHTRFVIVRFGNVLGSAGSVVPLFKEQIASGGPVTVTDPDVTRYFMTIPEAAQLILQAGAVGETGEIYVLDMGEPVIIRELAEQMILLSGKTPGRDIQIQFTGLRPGEKLHEELFHSDEDLQPTPFPKLRLARHRHIDWQRYNEGVEALRRLCVSGSDDAAVQTEVQKLIRDLACETHPLRLQARA